MVTARRSQPSRARERSWPTMPNSVGRMELFARLGRITVAETMIDNAAAYVSELEWRHQLRRHATRPRFTLSRFPGGARSCERQLVYDLMNFAHTERCRPWSALLRSSERPSRSTRSTCSASTAACSRPTLTPRIRSRIEDNDSLDFWAHGHRHLPPFWNRPLLIEKKTKDGDVVDEMRALRALLRSVARLSDARLHRHPARDLSTALAGGGRLQAHLAPCRAWQRARHRRDGLSRPRHQR
jgi:hypothetical protein